VTSGIGSTAPNTGTQPGAGAEAIAPITGAIARGAAPPALLGVVAATALLVISPIPLWATSIRDVVGNGFARIVYEASAWSLLLAPWMPIGVVSTALAGVSAAVWWLSGRGSAVRVAFLAGWVALSLFGSLALAAALLPGVLDSYRGPNGFHEMHLRSLYYVGLILAAAVLASGIAALLRPSRAERFPR
jgi:hypothetical protein